MRRATGGAGGVQQVDRGRAGDLADVVREDDGVGAGGGGQQQGGPAGARARGRARVEHEVGVGEAGGGEGAQPQVRARACAAATGDVVAERSRPSVRRLVAEATASPRATACQTGSDSAVPCAVKARNVDGSTPTAANGLPPTRRVAGAEGQRAAGG